MQSKKLLDLGLVIERNNKNLKEGIIPKFCFFIQNEKDNDFSFESIYNIEHIGDEHIEDETFVRDTINKALNENKQVFISLMWIGDEEGEDEDELIDVNIISSIYGNQIVTMKVTDFSKHCSESILGIIISKNKEGYEYHYGLQTIGSCFSTSEVTELDDIDVNNKLENILIECVKGLF